RPLSSIGQQRCQPVVEHRPYVSGPVTVEGAQPTSHRLRERVVRSAVTVGRAASLHPPCQILKTVDIRPKLPAQTGLAQAGSRRYQHEIRRTRLLGVVEELLDHAQLSVPTDHWG